MKLLRHKPDQFVFVMAPSEQMLLAAILKIFPLVPVTHHRLSRGPDLPDAEANQQLLAESLAAQQTETRNWVRALLAEPERFKVRPAGFHFAVSRAELEGLLQVMNDVRIGSWLALGSPETEAVAPLLVNEASVRHVQRMHLAAFFQTIFLAAVNQAG